MYSKIYIYSMMTFTISVMLMLTINTMIFNNSLFLDFKFVNMLFSKMGMVFLIDFYSLFFSFAVLLITSMVVIFSNIYMGQEKKFMVILTMFFSSMILLIFSVNLFALMFAWDGLGITSFLLIAFYSNFEAIVSSFGTFVTTRLGDLMIISAMVFNINKMDCIKTILSSKLMITLLILGMMTKSAQYPFISWLPMAMSAPTPVSSLVHSSTLVTAGIYLMIRFEMLIFKKLFVYMTFMSLITMFFGSLFAMSEKDFKKLIAMSTLSQMGLLSFLMSMGEIDFCFFHMIMHAFFKSMLFMTMGMVMKNNLNEQDIRIISLNPMSMNKVFYSMTISSMSMYGVPFLSGFFVKDFFYASIMSMDQSFYLLVGFFLSCIFTAVYSLRILKEIWFNHSMGNKMFFLAVDQNVFYIMMATSTIIVVMGKFFESMFLMEDLNMFFCRDKSYLLMAYTWSIMAFWVSIDFTNYFKNFFCSMMFMNYWSFKSMIKSKHIKKDKMENMWSESMNMVLKKFLKINYVSNLIILTSSMVFIFILILC